jgi:hypothetical protein
MRDEIKAAAVGSVILAAVVSLIAMHRPVDWEWGPVPIPPPAKLIEEPLPPARFEQFLARYGPPSFEEQSPHGMLQPPLFTKWLDYEPEHLRVAFVAAEPGESGAVRRWVLISFIDATRTQPISAEEAARRLMSRRR